MSAPPPLKHEILDQLDTIFACVDRKGREMDEKWGVGRLPSLVPIEVAERFRSQKRKFSAALWSHDAPEARKHGDAMIRAYVKLDEMAEASGAEQGPPDQWEFETPVGLVILVRDIRRKDYAARDGRKAQVWSIDEIVNVIRAHPILAAAKDVFPGCEIETVRPSPEIKDALDDALMDVPF